EEVGAAEAVLVLLLALGRREPVGPLPAELLPEHGAQRLHAVVAGRRLQRPRPRPFLQRIVQNEDVLVALLVLYLRVALVGIGAEAPRIDVEGIDVGLAVDHPVRQQVAGTAGGSDAEAEALGEPEVLLAPRPGHWAPSHGACGGWVH